MRRRLRSPAGSRRVARLGDSGAAAVEFALLTPFLVLMIMGMVDMGLALVARQRLAAAVSAGAEYALINGESLQVSVAAFETAIQTFIKQVSTVPITGNPTVVYNFGQSATSCYCVTGAAQTWSGPFTCGAACTDGSGSTAGQYVSITATTTFSPLFPTDDGVFAGPLSDSVLVRLD